MKMKTSTKWLTHAALIVLIGLIDIPFLSMLATSLKTRAEALTSISLFPETWSVENYLYVMQRTGFMRNVAVSAIIAVVVTFVCVFVAAIGGYAICRFKGRVFSGFSLLLLLLQMFPSMLMLIPLFLLFKDMGLINNPLSLVLSYTTFNLPFSIWLLNSFFSTIPMELEESAMMDGCGRFRVFLRIVLPIAMPGVCTAGIFTFINCWNEYTLASIFIKNQEYYTITLGLQQFILQYESDWPALMTASTIATLPTIAFLLVAQRFLIQGMTAGAVKG